MLLCNRIRIVPTTRQRGVITRNNDNDDDDDDNDDDDDDVI